MKLQKLDVDLKLYVKAATGELPDTVNKIVWSSC